MQEAHVMYYIQIKNPCARKTCNPNRARMFQNVVVYISNVHKLMLRPANALQSLYLW